MSKPGWVLLSLALVVAGCAHDQGSIVSGTGKADVRLYEKRGMNPDNAVKAAKRDATLRAQKNLIERYAGDVLPADKHISDFVAKSDEFIMKTHGLVQGVRVTRVVVSSDRKVFEVFVEAKLESLRRALGDGPAPKDPRTRPITWPPETGGVSD